MEENTDNRPLPPPRKSVTSKYTKNKPPVPLPRKLENINNSVLKDGSSSTFYTFKDINASFKKLIKPEIKMASENILERRKSVIDNTRSVSIYIEKSFRNLLPRPARKHTISQSSTEDLKQDVSNSPSDNDIFSSLSFDSPIPSDSNSDRSFSNYYCESDFSQPPNFPPPPLPQEALYDKIPGSSNSSSQCGSYTTENIYEFIGGSSKTQGYSYENWNPTNERSFKNCADDVTKHEQMESHEIVHLTQQIDDSEETSNDTKSILVQFDPLVSLLDKQKKDSNGASVLLQEIDEVLRSSHCNTVEQKSVESCELETLYDNLCAPEPPDRVDSITELSKPIDVHSDDIQVDPIVAEKPRRNSLKNWFNSLKKVPDGSAGSARKTKSVLKSEEKSNFAGSENSSIFHNGVLCVSIDEKIKDFEKKWCQIVGGQFKYTTSKDQIGNSISLASLLSIQIVDELKQK